VDAEAQVGGWFVCKVMVTAGPDTGQTQKIDLPDYDVGVCN